MPLIFFLLVLSDGPPLGVALIYAIICAFWQLHLWLPKPPTLAERYGLEPIRKV